MRNASNDINDNLYDDACKDDKDNIQVAPTQKKMLPQSIIHNQWTVEWLPDIMATNCLTDQKN